MFPEIKGDLSAGPVRYQRSRQAACIDVQGRMPGMVEPRRSCKSVLAHDLRIDVERGTCLAPLRERDVWPICVHSPSLQLSFVRAGLFRAQVRRKTRIGPI